VACRHNGTLRHAQTVKEPVLVLKPLHLGSSDKHVRRGDDDAVRRLDNPSEVVVTGLHTADRDASTWRAIAPKQRQQVQRFDICEA
jgi:hypothetical protein